jgi:peptidyl-prolyl cis-trans isomerase D
MEKKEIEPMAKRQLTATPGLTRRQLSRAQREARLQRIIVIGTAVVVLAVIGAMSYGVIRDRIIVPNKVLATVNGEEITVKEYQDRVLFEYWLYARNPMSQFGGPFNPLDVLDTMVDDIIVAQKAEEMGITFTDEEIAEKLELLFGYDAGDPEPTSSPFPTDVPTSDASPTVTATFVLTPTTTPTGTPDPAATEAPTEEPTEESTGEPTGEPTETEEPTVEPTFTPAPTSTPINEEDYNKAKGDVVTEAVTMTEMTEEEFEAVLVEWVRANVLREELAKELDYTIAETNPTVHAAHILVNSEEEAQEILDQLEDGESFEELAAELSRDTVSAYKGGDLGWIVKGDMVEQFEEVAFNTPVGDISDPVQSQFGWHLIKVYDRVEKPTTPIEQETEKQTQFTEMIEEWKAEADIDIDDNYPSFVPPLPEQQQAPQLVP